MLTVVYWPPERICAIDLEMDGFSATHNTRMYYARITVVVSRGVSQEGGANGLMSKEGVVVTGIRGPRMSAYCDRVSHVNKDSGV